MSPQLTINAVSKMYTMNGSTEDPSFTPVVQIINIKKIDGKGGDTRYRLVLSDGTRSFSGLIATQLNSMVEEGPIKQNCLLRIAGFCVNQLGSNTKVAIVTACEVVGQEDHRLGSSTDVSKVGVVAGFERKNEGGGGGMYGNVDQGMNQGGGMSNPQCVVSNGNNNDGGMYNNNGGGMNNNNNNNNSGGMNNSNNYGGMNNNQTSSNPYGNNTSSSNPYGSKSTSSPIVRTDPNGQQITPIASLNMYSNRWVIKAKITNKSDIRHWSNAKGEGSLFSITLLDSSGHDVKCTFFKEAVDKFYNVLEEGKIYTFSGGRLKVANMQYNNCKSQFEITFDQNSEIHLMEEGGGDIQEQYEFRKIAELENMEPGGLVDVLGVVKQVGDVASITSKKSGKDLLKCELIIEDDSQADVKMTVWGKTAETAPAKFANCPVVAFKRARLSDYGGRSLSAGGIAINPSIPQANQLQAWWASNGNKTQSRSLSSAGGGGGRDTFESRKEVCSIKQEHMGNNDKPDWLTFKATFNFIKREKAGGDDGGGCWYTACANSGEPCKNMFKATQTSDGNWHCDKCQQTNPNCVRRFIVSACVIDDTATTWVSVFNEQMEMMFNGITADQLYLDYENTGSKDLYDSTFLKSNYTDWVMTCKVKQELVGDETRTKTQIARMSPFDFAKESKNLLNALLSF